MPFWLLGVVSESCKVLPVVLQAFSVQLTLPVGICVEASLPECDPPGRAGIPR